MLYSRLCFLCALFLFTCLFLRSDKLLINLEKLQFTSKMSLYLMFNVVKRIWHGNFGLRQNADNYTINLNSTQNFSMVSSVGCQLYGPEPKCDWCCRPTDRTTVSLRWVLLEFKMKAVQNVSPGTKILRPQSHIFTFDHNCALPIRSNRKLCDSDRKILAPD